MQSRFRVIALVLLCASTFSTASSYVVPTTTLAAQTGNNTSAATTFASQTNGNRGAANISKLDVHSLLYAGASTKVYAHLLLWFGQANHMNVGYSSTDPAQIQRQVEDMISRGIDGVIIDWYGPNNAIDQATQMVMTEAEKHPGFTFAIMVDQGAIEWDACSGCTAQQALVAQLQYIEQTYFPSPAYLTVQGQPVLTNFNLDLSYTIDWNAAAASLSSHPFFMFQNNNGFSHVLSDGSYSWVMPTTLDYGMGYLSSFYGTGETFPNEQTVGAAYKGFNDTLASWGSDRIMRQQCGQTWLQTFSVINRGYSSGKQLAALQLVTWNDYEEGTEIESGIDNCLSLSATATENTLQWTVNGIGSGGGNENTVDHYVVYISADGQNLMPLTNLATGVYSLNLCSFPIPSGSYELFVQAVGKASLANQMSSGINYSPSCNALAQAPTFSLSGSPSSVSIGNGESATLSITASPQSGAFSDSVSFSCTGLPAGWSCSFSPKAVTPGSSPATSTLTLIPAAVSAAKITPARERTKPSSRYSSWLLGFGIAGFAFTGNWKRRGVRALAICGLIGFGMMAASCGGKSTGTQNVASNFAVTVQGNSTSIQSSTTIRVSVQ